MNTSFLGNSWVGVVGLGYISIRCVYNNDLAFTAPSSVSCFLEGAMTA